MKKKDTLNLLRKSAIGRHRRDSDPQDDERHYDGGQIEDYEDSTIARRPSDFGQMALTDESVSRIKDLMIVAWVKIGTPMSVIAKVLNISTRSVQLRYSRIPERTKAHYERIKLG